MPHRYVILHELRHTPTHLNIPKKMNYHVIEFNFSRSTFQVLAHCDTRKQANDVVERVKSHFNYQGNPLDIVSAYELGYLEAIA